MHVFTSYVTLVSGFSCENKPHLCSCGFPFPSLCSDQRCPGDSQEVVRLVVQAVQFYERKLRDFYTHLRYTYQTLNVSLNNSQHIQIRAHFVVIQRANHFEE